MDGKDNQSVLTWGAKLIAGLAKRAGGAIKTGSLGQTERVAKSELSLNPLQSK